ncbi:MAG: 2-oxo-4-hydroxy-4-carboxy-5-ureidoimidazoline decarboxylase [Acidobacteriota bacterium]
MVLIKVYKKLEWLNQLPADEAERVFRECSGSHTWARKMAAQRSFAMIEQLFERAEELWAVGASPSADSWPKIRDRLGRLLER